MFSSSHTTHSREHPRAQHFRSRSLCIADISSLVGQALRSGLSRNDPKSDIFEKASAGIDVTPSTAANKFIDDIQTQIMGDFRFQTNSKVFFLIVNPQSLPLDLSYLAK